MNLKLNDLKLIDIEVERIFEWIKKNERSLDSNVDKLNVCILIKLKTIMSAVEKIDLKDITVDNVPLAQIQKRKIKNYTLEESFNKLINKIPTFSKYIFILSVINFDFGITFNMNIYHVLYKFKITIKVAENLLENMSIFKLISFRKDEEGLEKLIRDLVKSKLSTGDFFTDERMFQLIMIDDIVVKPMSNDNFDKYYNILSKNKDMSYLNMHYILNAKKQLEKEYSDKFISNFCDFINMDIMKPKPNDYADDDLFGDVLNKILIESCLIRTILSNIENKYFGYIAYQSLVIPTMSIAILEKQEEVLRMLKDMLKECED